MINTAEVILWGTRIGIIHINEGRSFLSFEYDNRFLRSGIELSPLKMPLSERVYEFPELAGEAFHGAPGLVADSLPDRFGNAIIEKWLMDQGRSLNDFNAIDRLCYTGSRGMGALEYVPATGPLSSDEDDINLKRMVEFASEILSGRKKATLHKTEDLSYAKLVTLGTSAGGARAKAVIAFNEETHEIKSGQIDAGKGYDYWLIKFDGVKKNGDHQLEDKVEYTSIEYAYYLMAGDSKINISECRLLEDSGMHHFMTKRFDRAGNRKIHMQTLGALAHIDYNIPCLCSYEQAAAYMRQLDLSFSEIEQFYRRMVFNILLVNQDDHVKNTSFLMDRSGKWSLAPAYDITFSYDKENRWLKAHQMTVNSKNTDFSKSDLLSAGKQMGLSGQKCSAIINEIAQVAENMGKYFEKAGIKEKTFDAINKVVKEHQVI